MGPPRGSFDFNQLDRFAARTFDHYGARVSELVWPAQTFDPLTPIAKINLLTQEPHALAPQLHDPGIEVGDAESKMIRQVAPSAHQRSVILPCVPLHGDIIKSDAAVRLPAGAFELKRRPTPFATFYFAVGLGG
jgi:hypothetical protein